MNFYEERPELNITPLVDIMLVLLAILMVTTPTLIYEEQILLPNGSKTKISGAKRDDLLVRIDKNRKIYIDKRIMNMSEFADNIMLLTKIYDINATVSIKADKNLLYKDVMFVLTSLKLAGFTKIALQTNG